MAKLSQIRRLAILINKLSAVRYVPTDALVAHVENTLALYDNKDSNYSQRTMQRDFGLIDEMFGIVIRNDKSRGYYIAELDEMTDNYKELLLNFELLSSINTDSVLQKYVLAEHRRNAIRHELIAPLLKAIRKRNPIEFDYTLVRHNGKIVHKRLMPHFLKESQYRWYLIGYDTDGKLKSFGVDRISAINILEDTQFLRDEHIDIPSLFRESYGIWNNPEDPVEEIVLKYDSVDGAFVKTLPPASLATNTLRRQNRYHRQTAIAHYQRLRHGTAFPQPIGRSSRATHPAHPPVRYAATSRRTKQTY